MFPKRYLVSTREYFIAMPEGPALVTENLAELQTLVKESHNLLPVGNRTKNALGCDTNRNATKISTAGLSGIVAYDPSEFLITAKSGTTVQELGETLAKHGQYLPFDPLFAAAGATLGGTVASGVSGPGRLLYGSLRDFVMEVELIDGLGNLVRGGGKVVKNAAGFDLPKLLVGSYGRLGVLTEVTLKVLPAPAATQSVMIHYGCISDGVEACRQLLAQPMPINALDIDSQNNLWIEFAGLQESMDHVIRRAEELLGRDVTLAEGQEKLVEQFDRLESDLLIRVALNPSTAAEFAVALDQSDSGKLLFVSSGGALAWIRAASLEAARNMNALLNQFRYSAVVIRGEVPDLCLLGDSAWTMTADLIQRAMDPDRKFLPFEAYRKSQSSEGAPQTG